MKFVFRLIKNRSAKTLIMNDLARWKKNSQQEKLDGEKMWYDVVIFTLHRCEHREQFLFFICAKKRQSEYRQMYVYSDLGIEGIVSQSIGEL